ncbi:MAG: hypothetical protein H7A24_15795 [Leptospiraceae bacterium]|nr:hypothetical protein [Leptospiraceae bacterium]MCP5513350.1 hypothetical protein [Leptospiraceae bacterium]
MDFVNPYSMRDFYFFIIWFFFLALTVLVYQIFFGITEYAGLDFFIGGLSIFWLLIITTVPWNSYFKAKEILNDALISRSKEIKVSENDFNYVRKVEKYSLRIAILLHVFSSLGMFCIGYFGISPIGYFGAVLSILFTFLRPAVRFYEYLVFRMRSIREEFLYPREDVNTLRADLEALKMLLDDREDSQSWKKKVDAYISETDLNLKKISEHMEVQNREWKDEFKNSKLALESVEQKIINNSQLVESIRSIAKFFKQA